NASAGATKPMTQSALERARQRLSVQDVAGARRECASILDNSAADPRNKAGAHLVLAACSQQAADDASALAHVQSALALTPEDPLACYALAELLEKSGDKPGAIESVRCAIERNAGFVQAWNYLGILLGESGDDAGAEQAFGETVRLDPQHARAWNN